MRFYESEAKKILAKHGVPVPEGRIATTAADAERIAGEIGGTVAIKAEVISPRAITAAAGRTASSPAEARTIATELLAIDDGGRPPRALLVEARPEAMATFSMSVTYDGVAKRPVLAAAATAGKIEDLAETAPEQVHRRHFSALSPFSDYQAKELTRSLGLSGADLTRLSRAVASLARFFLDYDLTLVDLPAIAKVGDGKFVFLDAFMDMEVEGRARQGALTKELGIADDDTRQVRVMTQFEIDGAKIDADDPRGIISPIADFDGNIGLVIGAGGGSLTLTDAVMRAGGKPANYAAIGGNPSVSKAEKLTKLVLSKKGVEKIAVMSNVVSNTRADLVARGVIKGVLALGKDPKETIAIFRVPGAWESDAFKILDKYGIEYCDRTVSISEAAKRAVEKIAGGTR